MRPMLIACALAACYHAGPLEEPAGVPMSLGCIAGHVARRGDESDGAVIRYAFTNRCDRPVIVDLSSARAVGRDAAGCEHELTVYDPRHEIEPLPIDARSSGSEDIEYLGVAGRELAQICVDVGALDRSAPRAPRWICPDVEAP